MFDDHDLREAFLELDAQHPEPGTPAGELHRRLDEALFPEEVVVRFNGEVAEALAAPLLRSLLTGTSKPKLMLIDVVKGLL